MTEEQIKGVCSPREKILVEQLDRYIWNEKDVLREVPFTQFITEDEELGVGFLFPMDKEFEYKGQIIGQEQVWKPVIITSKPRFHPVERSENRALGVKFQGIPQRMPRRYSILTPREWLLGSRKPKDAAQIFQRIKAAYEKYLFFNPAWYAVHACWDMATYFFMLFPAFPYLELRGVKGAAKTKVMSLSRCFTLNASEILTSPSESSLFRLVNDVRATIYIDEAENLFHNIKGKIEHGGVVEVINSGYQQEGNVSKSEYRGKKWVPVVYATYSPKMIASIKGLYGATESRAIVHVMTRAPDSDPRGETEVNRDLDEWQEIRDELFIFMMANWQEVKKNYDSISDQTGLKKRELQLWRPLLSIAKMIGEEVEEELLGVAEHQQIINKADEFGESSWEYLILERAWQLIKGGERVLLYKELAEAIPEDKRPSSKTVSRLLSDIGFRDFKRPRTNAGYGIKIQNENDFRVVAEQLVPNIFSSPTSPSSQETELEGYSTQANNNKVKQRELSEEKPNEASELNEANEPSERHRDLKGVIQDFLNKAENGKIYSIEAIAELCNTELEEISSQLKREAEDGKVFSPKPGFWGVLR